MGYSSNDIITLLAFGLNRSAACESMENTNDKAPTICPNALVVVDWIDMIVFNINPNLVMADRDQKALLRLLEKPGLDVIPSTSFEMMAGGLRCVPWRSAALERFSYTSIRRTA